MLQFDISISDLAQRAGVSVRTIRYYINEGLLPAPEIRGRYTYYSENYIYRLELIHKLKNAFLPLKEIRQRMLSLTDEEVRELAVVNQPNESSKNENELPIRSDETVDSKSSALDYINHILKENSPSQAFIIQSAPAPVSRCHSRPQSMGITENLSTPGMRSQPAEETWQHVVLAPGFELHFRLPLPAEYAGRIQQVIIKVQELLR